MTSTTDLAAVMRLLRHYADACDSRSWDAFDEVFADDVTVDFAPGFRREGRDGAVKVIRNALTHCGASQHLLGSYDIDLAGDRGHSRVTVRAFHSGVGAAAGQTYEMFGEYDDDVVRTAAGWRIQVRRIHVRHELGPRTVLGQG